MQVALQQLGILQRSLWGLRAGQTLRPAASDVAQTLLIAGALPPCAPGQAHICICERLALLATGASRSRALMLGLLGPRNSDESGATAVPRLSFVVCLETLGIPPGGSTRLADAFHISACRRSGCGGRRDHAPKALACSFSNPLQAHQFVRTQCGTAYVLMSS
jgi:hypothetical protein